MFAAYNRSMIKKQLLIYLSVTLFLSVMMLLPFGYAVQGAITSLVIAITPFLYKLAPIALNRGGDSRLIDRMIPASAAEKLTFYVIYFLGIVALATFLLPEFAEFLARRFPSLNASGVVSAADSPFNANFAMKFCNIAGEIAPAATCLYVMNRARNNRIIKSVLSVLAVEIAFGIMGAFYAMGYAFSLGFEAGRTGGPVTFDPDMVARQAMDHLLNGSPFLLICAIVTTAYSILMLWLTYRNMKKSNI